MKKFPRMVMLFITITTSSAYASFLEFDDDAEFEDGFYAGISLGANWAQADWSGTSSISLVDEIHDPDSIFESWTPQGNTHDSGKFLGNVAFGYQFVDKRLYWGGEISGTFSDSRNIGLDDRRTFELETTINPPQPQISILTGTSHTQSTVSLGNNEFDIDLKPGILIWENFLVFARVGVAFTTLKIKSSGQWTEKNNFNMSPPAPPEAVELKASDYSHNSKNVVGFRVGAGAEYLLSEHLGVSLDYIFSDYGKIETRAEGQASFYSDRNQLYGVHAPQVKITTQTLMAGIIYHF